MKIRDGFVMKHIREWDIVTWSLIVLGISMVLFFLVQVLPHGFPLPGE